MSEQAVSIILQFLDRHEFHEAMLALERESSIKREPLSPELQFLRELVLEGEFEKAVKLLAPLQKQLHQDQFRSMVFTLRKQWLFELVQKPDPDQLHVLIEGEQGLKHICTKTEFKNLIIYLSLNSIREDPGHYDWTPLKGRLKAFNFIKDSLMLYCSGIGGPEPTRVTFEEIMRLAGLAKAQKKKERDSSPRLLSPPSSGSQKKKKSEARLSANPSMNFQVESHNFFKKKPHKRHGQKHSSPRHEKKDKQVKQKSRNKLKIEDNKKGKQLREVYNKQTPKEVIKNKSQIYQQKGVKQSYQIKKQVKRQSLVSNPPPILKVPKQQPKPKMIKQPQLKVSHLNKSQIKLITPNQSQLKLSQMKEGVKGNMKQSEANDFSKSNLKQSELKDSSKSNLKQSQDKERVKGNLKESYSKDGSKVFKQPEIKLSQISNIKRQQKQPPKSSQSDQKQKSMLRSGVADSKLMQDLTFGRKDNKLPIDGIIQSLASKLKQQDLKVSQSQIFSSQEGGSSKAYQQAYGSDLYDGSGSYGFSQHNEVNKELIINKSEQYSQSKSNRSNIETVPKPTQNQPSRPEVEQQTYQVIQKSYKKAADYKQRLGRHQAKSQQFINTQHKEVFSSQYNKFGQVSEQTPDGKSQGFDREDIISKQAQQKSQSYDRKLELRAVQKSMLEQSMHSFKGEKDIFHTFSRKEVAPSLKDCKLVVSFNEDATIRMARFSPSDTYIAYGTNSSSLKVYLADRQKLQPQQLPLYQYDKIHMGSVFCLDFSQDETKILTCSNDSTVKLLNLPRKEAPVVVGHQGSLSSRSVCFCDHDTAALSCGEDGSLHVWDIERQQKRGEYGKGRLGVLTCAKEHEGRIYACGLNRTLVQVDPRSEYVVNSLEMDSQINFLQFYQGCIATAHKNGRLNIHDMSFKMLGEQSGHAGEIRSVRASTSQTHLLSSSFDCSVKLWGAQEEGLKELGQKFVHSDKAVYAQFNHSGSLITTTSTDCSCKVWALD